MKSPAVCFSYPVGQRIPLAGFSCMNDLYPNLEVWTEEERVIEPDDWTEAK